MGLLRCNAVSQGRSYWQRYVVSSRLNAMGRPHPHRRRSYVVTLSEGRQRPAPYMRQTKLQEV